MPARSRRAPQPFRARRASSRALPLCSSPPSLCVVASRPAGPPRPSRPRPHRMRDPRQRASPCVARSLLEPSRDRLVCPPRPQIRHSTSALRVLGRPAQPSSQHPRRGLTCPRCAACRIGAAGIWASGAPTAHRRKGSEATSPDRPRSSGTDALARRLFFFLLNSVRVARIVRPATTSAVSSFAKQVSRHGGGAGGPAGMQAMGTGRVQH